MEIKSINDKNELLEVIIFLKSAFNWSQDKAFKLNKDLLKNNKSFGVYGYALKNNEEVISGALLLFYQGNFEYKRKNIKIINMSSWYVVPKMRGNGSLKMIKKLLNDYSEYLITNVTSNSTAYKILKAFSFKDSFIVNRKFTLYSFIKNQNIFNFSLYEFIYRNNFKKLHITPKNFSRGNSYCRKFCVKNSSLYVVFSPTIWEKKIGIIYLKIRGIRILSTSNPEIFKDYFYHIFLFNFFKNFSLFTTTHCNLDISKKSYLKSSKQIYFPPQKFSIDEIELALGSELAFI